MKVQVDGKEIFTLEEWEKKVLLHELKTQGFEEDLCRRLEYVLKHKVDRCFERLQAEWIEILRKDPSVTQIPVGKKEFVEMVTSRVDYKNRTEREEVNA